MAVREMPDGGERSGSREEQLNPLLTGRTRGQQAQRSAEPVCGARRRAVRRRLARGTQGRDRSQVTLPCGALDVVRTGCCRCAPGCQRSSDALVSTEPPASERGLVDRSPDEWVAKAKPSRHVRLAHEVELKELVECLDCRCLGPRGRARRQFGLEGVARDRGSLQHDARAVRQQGELLGQCGGDRGWDVDVSEPNLSSRSSDLQRSIEGAGELLEVERVATAFREESTGLRFVHRFAEELVGFGPAERTKLDPDEAAGAVRVLERAREPLRNLAGTPGQGDENRRGRAT